MLNLFSFHLISSHRSFSWKLLIASLCHRHPISSQLIWCLLSFFTSSHLIPSDVFSPFLNSSQLITTVLISSHVTWPFLISSQLISAFQIFTALLNSSQLSAAHVSLSYVFSSLLSSSHIYSADLSSCQLVSPHLSSSQRTLKSYHLFSGPKPAPKTVLGAKASNPYAFHREDLTQRSFYTWQAFAQRSLYTQKLLHRVREAFIHSKLLHKASVCTQQAFTQKIFCTRKLLHRSLYTEKLLHTASFDTKKLLHRKAFTHRKLLHRSFYTKKHLAFTHRSLYTAFTHSEPSRREAATQKSF